MSWAVDCFVRGKLWSTPPVSSRIRACERVNSLRLKSLFSFKKTKQNECKTTAIVSQREAFLSSRFKEACTHSSLWRPAEVVPSDLSSFLPKSQCREVFFIPGAGKKKKSRPFPFISYSGPLCVWMCAFGSVRGVVRRPLVVWHCGAATVGSVCACSLWRWAPGCPPRWPCPDIGCCWRGSGSASAQHKNTNQSFERFI